MKRSGVIFGLVISLWIGAILAGMFVLMQYDNTPGMGTLTSHWPDNSQINLSSDSPTLIMFVHPQCPCTRASITELKELVAECKTKFKTYVLLFTPKSIPSGWDKTALVRSAQDIPGAVVLNDIDGIEARRFHSLTSGQTMIYNPQGQLLFSGGITAARGQEGVNASFNSAKLTMVTQSSTSRQTPVFGCSIVDLNKK